MGPAFGGLFIFVLIDRKGLCPIIENHYQLETILN